MKTPGVHRLLINSAAYYMRGACLRRDVFCGLMLTAGRTTGKSFRMEAIELWRIQDGKIVELRQPGVGRRAVRR